MDGVGDFDETCEGVGTWLGVTEGVFVDVKEIVGECEGVLDSDSDGAWVDENDIDGDCEVDRR